MQLYRSEDVNVLLHDAESDITLVTFAPLNHPTDDGSFWGDTFVRKAAIRTVGVIAQSTNWYPRRSMMEALPAIRARIPQWSRVVTYGASMGAYAAIKYSRALDADTVIAFAPQFTIDPSHPSLHLNPFSKFYNSDLHGQMAIEAADCAGQIFLLFDPFFKFDQQNAELISGVAEHVTNVPLFFSGHDAVRMFAGTEICKQLIYACLERDSPSLCRLVHNVRRSAPLRARELCIRLVKRNPVRAADIFDRYGGKLNTNDTSAFLFALADNLLKFGFVAKARLAMSKLAAPADDPRYAKLFKQIEIADEQTNEKMCMALPAPVLRAPSKLLAQRLYTGQFKYIPKGVTIHQCVNAETDFEAVRLVYSNDLTVPYRIRAVVASSSKPGAAPVNAAGKIDHTLWQPVTFGPQQAATCDVAPAEAQGRLNATFSNMIQIRSIQAADGSLPLLMVRTHLESIGRASCPHEGDRLDRADPDPRLLYKSRALQSYSRTLDGVSDPASFTSPTRAGVVFPAAYQFLAQRPGLTVMGVGDSLTQGGYPTPFPAWGARLCAITSSRGMPISWFSASVAGMKSALFYRQVRTILKEIDADIVFISTHSTNDSVTAGEGGLTALDTAVGLANAVVELGGVPILMTPMPNTKSAGTAREVRQQVTQQVRKLAASGSLVLDTEAILGETSDPSRLRAVFDFGDGIHLNEAGQDALALGALPLLTFCLGRVTDRVNNPG